MRKRKEQLRAEMDDCQKALLGLLFINAIYHNGKEITIVGKPFFDEPKDLVGEGWKKVALSRLSSLGYKVTFEQNNGQVILEIIKSGEKLSKIPWLNIILLGLTLLTTLAAGAYFLKGENIISNPLYILDGASFALPLMAILLFHESGHYILSTRRKIKTSLPYFIPGPTIFGTFGALIKSRSPFRSRKDLLDVGAAGPISGFIVAIIFVIIGLSNSEVVKEVSGQGLSLGDSLIFLLLSHLVLQVPKGHTVLLSPMAFAGWAGLFVTMLNLLPIGQLDGGHIFYALFGKHQKKIAWLALIAMLPLGYFWQGWLVWAALSIILINPSHPPTLNDDIPLDIKRKILGYISFFIFILCFIPVPIM